MAVTLCACDHPVPQAPNSKSGRQKVLRKYLLREATNNIYEALSWLLYTINILTHNKSTIRSYHYPHFTERESKDQSDQLICPESHSY